MLGKVTGDPSAKINHGKDIPTRVALNFVPIVTLLQSPGSGIQMVARDRREDAPNWVRMLCGLDDCDHPIFRIAQAEVGHPISNGLGIFGILRSNENEQGDMTIGRREFVPIDIRQLQVINFRIGGIADGLTAQP